MGNKIDINLCKSAKAKKQCHILPYSVLRICVALPLTATPTWVKGGNTICIHLFKRTKGKITDIVYLRLLRLRTGQCKYLKLTPDRNPKGVRVTGYKIDMYLCKQNNDKTSVISYLGFPSTE